MYFTSSVARDSQLTQQGAAEYFWEMLIGPLQR
jgi:hypothetical protein